jgi:hypothetical protein
MPALTHDQRKTDRFGLPPIITSCRNQPHRAAAARRRESWAPVVPKGHTETISDGPAARAAIPPPLEPRSGALKVLPCNRGDKAMWIVLYVAMIASFRAMGVAVAPVETDKDRGPFSDM